MRCEVVRQGLQWHVEAVYDGPNSIRELDELRSIAAIYGAFGQRGIGVIEGNPRVNNLIERLKGLRPSQFGEGVTEEPYKVRVAVSPNEIIEKYGNREPYQAALIYAQKGKLNEAQFRRNFPGAGAALIFHTNL